MEKLSLLEMEEVQGKSNGQEPFKLCAAASTMIRVYSGIQQLQLKHSKL